LLRSRFSGAGSLHIAGCRDAGPVRRTSLPATTSVALNARRCRSLHRWSAEHCSSGAPEGIAGFAARCASYSASVSFLRCQQRPPGRGRRRSASEVALNGRQPSAPRRVAWASQQWRTLRHCGVAARFASGYAAALPLVSQQGMREPAEKGSGVASPWSRHAICGRKGARGASPRSRSGKRHRRAIGPHAII